MRRILTKVDLVMPFSDRERLGQLARAGTESIQFLHAAAFAHEREPALRLDCTH